MDKTLTVRLDVGLNQELEEEARRLRRSKGEVVRDALRERLKRSRPSAFDALKGLCGVVQGPADLSTNKRHLAGLGRQRR